MTCLRYGLIRSREVILIIFLENFVVTQTSFFCLFFVQASFLMVFMGLLGALNVFKFNQIDLLIVQTALTLTKHLGRRSFLGALFAIKSLVCSLT